MTASRAWFIGLGWLAAYEVYAIMDGKETLSDAIWSSEGANPLIPFALGFCAAHFVFQTIRGGRPS